MRGLSKRKKNPTTHFDLLHNLKGTNLNQALPMCTSDVHWIQSKRGHNINYRESSCFRS